MLNTDKRTEILTGLQNTIHVKLEPLTIEEWRKKFADNGFHVTQKYGKLSLMDPNGMIRDEGFFDAFKIIRNGLKKENKEQFKKMFVFLEVIRKTMVILQLLVKKRRKITIFKYEGNGTIRHIFEAE